MGDSVYPIGSSSTWGNLGSKIHAALSGVYRPNPQLAQKGRLIAFCMVIIVISPEDFYL
jgi:hypothetical protein